MFGKRREPKDKKPRGKERCRSCGKVLNDNGFDHDTFRGECLRCFNEKARSNGNGKKGSHHGPI